MTIYPSRVDADIRVEAVDGADEGFPHIYGPLPLDAVTHTNEIPMGEDGRLLWTSAMTPVDKIGS